MKNIDKVKQMSPKELVKFMKQDKCDKCIYDNTNCQHDMCTEGMAKWLEIEVELTFDEMFQEIKKYCKFTSCVDCAYDIGTCRVQFAADRFNIINGKITRR